jgi:FMN phosphatase YigB (HAD superfamily)
MKVVSDFDGVLTDLTEEASRVRELFDEAVARATGREPGESALWLGEAEREMAAAPFRHGWRVKGRITAFCNEDGFVHTNALAAHLDRVRAGRDAGVDFQELAQQAYLRMVEETAAGHRHPLDPRTAPVLSALIARGHEVVVVSNSGTERICRLLEGVGLSPVAHGTGTGPLRVRGHAEKFRLGEGPRTFPVGEYVVDTDRPAYRTILTEERPDLVIGDVFSLDLALPLQLAREGELRGIRLVLRHRPYTPNWSRDYFSSVREDAFSCRLLRDLSELDTRDLL